jgi:hypothetical protein
MFLLRHAVSRTADTGPLPVRGEFTAMLMDLIRRGELALEAGDEGIPPEHHSPHG